LNEQHDQGCDEAKHKMNRPTKKPAMQQ